MKAVDVSSVSVSASLPLTALTLLILATVLGCGPTIPQLRTTAAGEMNCPVSELELERVDSKTMAVIGCGREKIYSKYCDKTDEGKTCGWRANAEPEAE